MSLLNKKLDSTLVEGGGFEPPKLARQIYSLIPLATREPLRKGAHSLGVKGECQHQILPSKQRRIPFIHGSQKFVDTRALFSSLSRG